MFVLVLRPLREVIFVQHGGLCNDVTQRIFIRGYAAGSDFRKLPKQHRNLCTKVVNMDCRIYGEVNKQIFATFNCERA